jgi:hypothetical protein
VNDRLREFVMAGPRPARDGLRVMLFLASRPRGRRLLGALPLALQAADSVLAMSRYDDPARARELGWDSDAVAARGRALRRAEGRP